MHLRQDRDQNREQMADISFRIMAILFKIRDWFRPPDRLLDLIGIREGMVVVDYGCGPGRYISGASRRVGGAGRLYAVDIHELAVEAVKRLVKEERLTNVFPILARGYDSGLPDGTADLVYALDMFHMIRDPATFLGELRRITKPDGVLVIDDGHQPRKTTQKKIRASGLWEIKEENEAYLRCHPK
ncbi:class I SAM-dependent methyltransferase [Methanofollis formosanus]|uniref:Class I SAM-dependent methyltransferase n=1 Tax=Methanofollis formosanus TaxID=299308 RepID=A0A8G1A3C0_9EURY|nr:class I SAM-dependent methyltransferase [Methanofollis formosanus]QYZ79317.1 class I SAM-dependent methyltransferase [Methanofollis formosanus]